LFVRLKKMDEPAWCGGAIWGSDSHSCAPGWGVSIERQRFSAEDGQPESTQACGAPADRLGAVGGAVNCTIEGLRHDLAANGIVVGYDSIRRFFEREGITRKKRH
jgi:hypothetical protein